MAPPLFVGIQKCLISIGIGIVHIKINFHKKWKILFRILNQTLYISKIWITLGAFHPLLARISRERYFTKTPKFRKSDRVSSDPQLSCDSCTQLDAIGKYIVLFSSGAKMKTFSRYKVPSGASRVSKFSQKYLFKTRIR